MFRSDLNDGVSHVSTSINILLILHIPMNAICFVCIYNHTLATVYISKQKQIIDYTNGNSDGNGNRISILWYKISGSMESLNFDAQISRFSFITVKCLVPRAGYIYLLCRTLCPRIIQIVKWLFCLCTYTNYLVKSNTHTHRIAKQPSIYSAKWKEKKIRNNFIFATVCQ